MKNSHLKSFILLITTAYLLLACNPKLIPGLAKKQEFRYSNSFKPLPNYLVKQGRNDDMAFLTNQKGWAISNIGKLSKTKDGGHSWHTQFEKDSSYFRSLAFKDSLNGWLGTIGTGQSDWVADTISLYETHDGGENWEKVKFDGPYPTGICGLQVVSDKMIVGSGRVRGPSYFIKSIDGGKTWQSRDMNHMAGLLITPYFKDEKNGFLIGGTHPTATKEESSGLILSTDDGGITWDTVYVTSQKNEWCWKVSFPSENVGYVSVQRNDDKGKYYFLKTVDGGKTWIEKEYTKDHYFNQAIGFVNEEIGWIGGDREYSYETRDGGETWYPIPEMTLLNRIIITGDMKGYASGSTIYKLDSLKPLHDGLVTTYFDGDIKKSEKNYIDGILNGESSEYYPSGELKSKGKYRNNLKNGNWSFWSTDQSEVKRTFRNDISRLSKKQLIEYVGVYKATEYDGIQYIHVKINKGKLLYKWDQFKNYRHFNYSDPDRFFDKTLINQKYKFTREKDKVNGVQYIFGEKVYYTFKKLSSEEAKKIAEKHKFELSE